MSELEHKIFVFDLDGTLAVSKGPIDRQMQELLKELLEHNVVCVVSGGKWRQFENQMLKHLADNGLNAAMLDNLHCFPTCGTTYYRHRGGKWDHKDSSQFNKWTQMYSFALTSDEKTDILSTFDTALAVTGHEHENPFGKVLEDRETQITFSALGQNAPRSLKEKWDPNRDKRREIIAVMQPMLPDFDVRLGGTTSIDVTKKGHDKQLAIKKIIEYFACTIKNLVFFGDALEPGGNDHAVYKYGVECIPVASHIDCVWKVRQYVRSLSR